MLVSTRTKPLARAIRAEVKGETMTTQSITSGQRKQIVRLMEDGLDALVLNKDGAQQLIVRGGDLQTKLKDVLRELAVYGRYADEEVESNYGYPEDYRRGKAHHISNQVGALREYFPELGTADEEIASGELPDGAEGWFAIPRWEKISPTYGEAVEKVFAMIASRRQFYNWREGQLGPECLRQHERTGMLQTLIAQQSEHDILIVPAQFGLRHRGRSVRRAREVFLPNEFGLDAFAVGCMLLTHPERLVSYDDLYIDCAGDEYDLSADGQFDRAPCFVWGGDGVGFGTGWVGNPNSGYGSASGFVPQ